MSAIKLIIISFIKDRANKPWSKVI